MTNSDGFRTRFSPTDLMTRMGFKSIDIFCTFLGVLAIRGPSDRFRRLKDRFLIDLMTRMGSNLISIFCTFTRGFGQLGRKRPFQTIFGLVSHLRIR